MSTWPVWSVCCNGPGCGRWIGKEGLESGAHMVARRAGWDVGVVYHQDFCAEHKREPEPAWSACHGARLAPDGACSHCGQSGQAVGAHDPVMPAQKIAEHDIPDMPSVSPPGKLS